MKHYVAEYAKEERLKLGLSCKQLAVLMGYRNITKGVRRLDNFEREGHIHNEVF